MDHFPEPSGDLFGGRTVSVRIEISEDRLLSLRHNHAVFRPLF
jgi:hypothetical protein